MSGGDEDREHELGGEQSFVSHLVELRDRLLKMVLAVLGLFVCLFPFSNQIYSLLAGPLIEALPENTTMLATGVATPFLIPFKLTLMLSAFLAVPVILYQVWAFVAPGLYRHEKRLVLPLVVSSTLLFYLGCSFAYFVVFPLAFAFFAATTPEGVQFAPDIGEYLSFVVLIFFAFGVAFEVPVATYLLCSIGVTTADELAAKRPYIIVGAFVVGMFLTPPDVISQTLLALPMWALFELGVILSRHFVRRPEAPARPAGDGRNTVPGLGGPRRSGD